MHADGLARDTEFQLLVCGATGSRESQSCRSPNEAVSPQHLKIFHCNLQTNHRRCGAQRRRCCCKKTLVHRRQLASRLELHRLVSIARHCRCRVLFGIGRQLHWWNPTLRAGSFFGIVGIRVSAGASRGIPHKLDATPPRFDPEASSMLASFLCSKCRTSLAQQVPIVIPRPHRPVGFLQRCWTGLARHVSTICGRASQQRIGM